MAQKTLHSRPVPSLLPGFTDVVHVATGGSADVLRAWQPAMGRMVAIKIYGDQGSRDADHELTVSGRLSVHPRLVAVHERGRTPSGHAYLVMPWYDGGSLGEAVGTWGPLPLAQALRIGVNLADALAHLHRHGILHRDVKPGNVLLTLAGEPVLADLGIAALPEERHVPPPGLTRHYAAPEILQGCLATPKSDVWSLVSTLRAVIDPQDVPTELGQLFDLATSADPAQRPSWGGALAIQLQAMQARLGLPVTELTAPSPPPLAPAAAGRAEQATTPASGALAGDETLLRPPPPGRRTIWPALAAGALTGTVLGILALAVAIMADLQLPT
jgi:serine/threonine-protein kinase PknK